MDPVVVRTPSTTFATYFLLACLAFATFAFGGMELWAREWLRFGVLACAAVVLWKGGPFRSLLPPAAIRLGLPALAMLVLAGIQLLPVPGAVLTVASPAAATLYEETAARSADLEDWLLDRAEAVGIAIDADAPETTLSSDTVPARLAGRTLSIYPHATRRALFTWVTPVLVFLVAASVARDRFLRYRMIWGVSLLTAALGATAVLQHVSWNGLILWIRARPPGSRSLGPFVNPNHFAGFVEMGGLVIAGLMLALIAQHGAGLDRASLRAALVDRGWTFPRLLLAGGCGVLGLAGLLLSQSRGGLLAAGAGILFVLIVRRSRVLVVVVVLLVVVAGLAVGLVSWIGADAAAMDSVPFAISSTDPSGFVRLNAWGTTLRVFTDYPVAGTGLGTFQWIFPKYQRWGEWKEWRQAHNDYVQLLAETGVIGAGLLLWALIVLGTRVLGPVSRGEPRWTTLGTAAAVFAMLVHSVLDFNLQVPANAALFAMLLGILAAAAGDPEGRTRRNNHDG